MGQILTGVGAVLFGLLIGGVGVATAGIGIGIPMIPIGIYLIIRGSRGQVEKKVYKKTEEEIKTFEFTKTGRFFFGIILILVGIATSAMVIGIPIAIIGLIMIISIFF